VTTNSKENREQLRIGQCIGSLREEAFSGTFRFGPLGDALAGYLSPH